MIELHMSFGRKYIDINDVPLQLSEYIINECFYPLVKSQALLNAINSVSDDFIERQLIKFMKYRGYTNIDDLLQNIKTICMNTREAIKNHIKYFVK